VKIRKIETEDLANDGRVMTTSIRTYFEGKEPECTDNTELLSLVQEAVDLHAQTGFEQARCYIATIFTSTGRFIKVINKSDNHAKN
jgi:hypothetical protein